MKKTKVKNAVAMFCNMTIIAFTIMCVLRFFRASGGANMQTTGSACFKYFTVDSNILLALTSAIALFFNMKTLKTGKEEMPMWASICKLVGTTAATVTFLTVLVFLGPTQGYAIMFDEIGLYLHLINPVLAILSICFFNGGFKIPAKLACLGVLPTAIYGAVYAVMVLIAKKWDDFYGFATVIPWYISIPVMLLVSLGICQGLNLLRNLCWSKKLNR